jgi:predicted PolB exonuclease-like 3'-5' exonuclease
LGGSTAWRSTHGQRTEVELIRTFIERIGELRPQLITFNGHSFDLPVLRYRAMVNRVSGTGLQVRPYFHRYTEDALDLCDVFGSYSPGAKIKLDEICKIIGLPGKPSGIDGGQVEAMVGTGRINEVAQYCEADVLNTYRLWLVYEFFRGAITAEQLAFSEKQIADYIRTRRADNPHVLLAIASHSSLSFTSSSSSPGASSLTETISLLPLIGESGSS